ncbi:hypothetical protein ACF1BN_36255 [Streptomyces sp. NPDC014861]|uniref:hypothetical protein n=1 Tax=Streptomyces sp. NPDC014861 TaxID=3364923 RepID=UPI0037024972
MTGTVAQLAAAWQVVSPLDTTTWQWILAIALSYCFALIYEDVRDMEGDRAIGRRTPALLVGPWPIRIWFSALMAGIPPLLHFLLFAPIGAAAWRIVLCDTMLAAVCWTAAVRALLLRHTAADRTTYQLYVLSYIIALATGPIL